MKKVGFIFLFILLILSLSVFAKYDGLYQEDTQTTFKLDSEQIEVQRDQTELEKQSIKKESEYRTRLTLRNIYYNELWTIIGATAVMVFDLVVFVFIIAITRLIIFFFVDLIPVTLLKMVGVFTSWSKK